MNGLGGGSTHSGGRLISFSYPLRGWRWRWLNGCSELNGGDLERTDGHLLPSSSRFLPTDADRRKQILRRQRRHHEEIIADPLSVVKGHTYIFIQPAIQTHVALRGEVRLFFFHGYPTAWVKRSRRRRSKVKVSKDSIKKSHWNFRTKVYWRPPVIYPLHCCCLPACRPRLCLLLI